MCTCSSILYTTLTNIQEKSFWLGNASSATFAIRIAHFNESTTKVLLYPSLHGHFIRLSRDFRTTQGNCAARRKYGENLSLYLSLIATKIFSRTTTELAGKLCNNSY